MSATAILVAALPAPVQTPVAAEAAAKGRQPVCVVLVEIGTRLATRRVCMTRDKWAEYRRDQRAGLLRTQGRLNER